MSEADPPSRLGPYRAMAHRFTIELRGVPVSIGESLDYVLSTLREDSASETLLRYVLQPGERDGRWTVHCGEDVVAEDVRLRGALADLLWHINHTAVLDASCRRTVMHAGVAALDGAALILPGRMESGKTTLVTGLLRRGWQYLSDEAAPLGDGGQSVRAYPKPLSIDEGSQRLFPDLDARRGGLAGLEREQWHVPTPAITGEPPVAEARPALFVFPTYEPESPTSLTEIPRSRALDLALRCTFDPCGRLTANFRTLAAALRGARCASLSVSDLRTALDLIEGWRTSA